jgi:hypothetical protein|tara:strand:+ start:31 stop:408 length:378 start_codon:yes stop_codon:yes gene_type:complete
MIVGLSNLKIMLLDKVCEVKFARRNPKPGRPASRRMLCTNNVQLLNSVEGRTVLNYLPPRQAPAYNPNQENLIITWDILMQDFRTINCDTVDLITTLDADQTFWVYINEKIAPMSAGEKMAFMNT